MLDVAIARRLYLEYPDFDEGRMTKVLAHVRSRAACAEVAEVLEAAGPPHDRTFVCAVLIDGEQLGAGTGKTKKDAEQEAAREALLKLRV